MEKFNEPWRLGTKGMEKGSILADREDGLWVIAQPNFNLPDYGYHESRRIVACVNACEGISTEDLEKGAIEETLDERYIDTWQPIETAPKDGTNIIGFTDFGVEVVRWCEWDGTEYSPHDGWIGVEQDSTCLPKNYRREKAQHQPTHWMPLPKPPMAASQGAQQ